MAVLAVLAAGARGQDPAGSGTEDGEPAEAAESTDPPAEAVTAPDPEAPVDDPSSSGATPRGTGGESTDGEAGSGAGEAPRDGTPPATDGAVDDDAIDTAEEAEAGLLTLPPDERPTERAIIFSRAFKSALSLEIDRVQLNEQSTLGKEKRQNLQGHRLKRRRRIDDDTEHFRDLANQLTIAPMRMPRPSPDLKLSKKGRLFLTALDRAYESSRDPKVVEQLVDANEEFLRTANWQVRDKAVRYRDDLIAREIAYSELSQRARDIVAGEDITDATLDEMLAKLEEISPETMRQTTDLATLVLHDDEVRSQVLGEVWAVLKSPRQSLAPPVPEDELAEQLPALEYKLMEASEVVELLTESTELSQELARIDQQLEDQGVNKLPPDERRSVAQRKSEIIVRQNAIRRQWVRTPPARQEFVDLMEAQDAMLRRRMFDLGHHAALYKRPYESLREEHDVTTGVPATMWGLIEAQAELIEMLDHARPEPGPLAGLEPPPAPTPPTHEQFLFNLRAAAKALESAKAKASGKAGKGKAGKPLPKPRKTKKKKKGGGRG